MLMPYQRNELWLIAMLLLINFNSSELKGYTLDSELDAISARSLRFRDFEPRQLMRSQSEDLSAMGVNDERKSRGFLFHASDHDMNVELEYIVPFISIPLERSMRITKVALRNLLNLNLSSLVTTAAIVAVGSVLFFVVRLLFSPVPIAYPWSKTSRNSEEATAFPYDYANVSDSLPAGSLMDMLETKIKENNYQPSLCIQRLICDYANGNGNAFGKSANGNIQKIMNGILSFPAVYDFMKDTAVHGAWQTARRGEDCASAYGECKWTRSLRKAMEFVFKSTKFF